jgi:hypothetical protein
MSNPSVGEFTMSTPPPPKNNNIKWIAGAIVVGLGFFGYVVQSGNNAQPTVVQDKVVSTPAPAPKPAPKPLSSKAISELAFVNALHQAYPNSRYAEDYELLDLGYEACKVFDAGVTVDQYALFFAKEFANDRQGQLLAASVGGAAIAALCPKHSWMLD